MKSSPCRLRPCWARRTRTSTLAHSARVHDGVAGNRDGVFACDMAAGIAVMRVPDVAVEVLLQDHDMAGADRRHARPGSSTGKPPPTGCEIQLRNDAAKPIQRRLASAKC